MDIEKCPWPGCKNEPVVHEVTLPEGGKAYWVICDTTVAADNALRAAGHMVTGPESDTADGAIERWNKRILTDANNRGRPKKA